LINVLLNGLSGSIVVSGKPFNGVMPKHDFMSDEEIAKVLTYTRLSFGNNSSAVHEKEVSHARNKLSSKVPDKNKN